ncbi:MAG: transcription termination/antitermination NusG family protein, partial [Muribaculaceae bacterium]
MEAANTNIEKQWYAIRVTYNRELKVKADLDAQGIDNFIPMKYVSVMRGKDRRVKKLVPAIHNLIFMLVDRNTMVQYKATTTLPIRY